MGVDRAEVLLDRRDARSSLYDSPTCEPSAGRAARDQRVPCPEDDDRRVTLGVDLPGGSEGGQLEVVAIDSLGERGQADGGRTAS